MHALDYYRPTTTEMAYPTYGYHNYYAPNVRLNYELKCKYAFKSCPNTRSAKKNGEMHKLCEYHRRKANNVQKYYARRKRSAKSSETGKALPETPVSDSDSGEDKISWANMAPTWSEYEAAYFYAQQQHKSSYELKCKYAFKNCTNVRSQKRTGGLHTLCEFHRQKANEIQKAYAQKKRQNPRPTVTALTPNTTNVEPIPFYCLTEGAGLEYEDCVDLIQLLV
ncbi:hypothetical protein ACHHYP_03320 [Achlya hypogyna]|uniref:Uncharacterized protein n=1 Tax=Achlya hypogyna TaxID=1202772 RepID=A0A1V9Z424_ACHHY|nr:hypothetical protein ACHHYP_03320 [Achlya hypogyna]